MAIEIKPYTDAMASAVIDFNKRLKKGGVLSTFPESNIPVWLPKIKERNIYQEYFLAVENESEVRGGYILKHQEFSFKGDILSIGVPRYPLSEGLIDKSHNLVVLQLLTDALRRKPLLYGLGIGGYEYPIYKIHKALGWSSFSVPFYFKVNHPFKFFRQIIYLRKTKLYRFLLDLLAITGIGWCIIKTRQFLLIKTTPNNNSVSVEIVNDFSIWADELWEKCKNKFSMIAVRNSNNLNILYPMNSDRFIRLKISLNDHVIGWVVVLDTQMSKHKQFGDMRVGSIIDCLALPEDSSKVIVQATKYLENKDVDIIVSNQSHCSWCSALGKSGFIKGPSNFIFTASQKLSKLISPIEMNKTNIHLNRGDGDGPINL